MKLVDCTLRDGGYYNSWDFSRDLVQDYLSALNDVGIDYVELGFRSLKNNGYKGPFAFTTDEYISTLIVPDDLEIGVMINASELDIENQERALSKLFPRCKPETAVSLVRIACHIGELVKGLAAADWLKNKGYIVGVNLMQITECDLNMIKGACRHASDIGVDVLYFADSLGSMTPNTTKEIVNSIKIHWQGETGIHAHDNMGVALQNSLAAMSEGVSWVDGTITGMGRGPGNAKTEQLLIEVGNESNDKSKMVPLMQLINKYFEPLKEKYSWGGNFYYYLSGKYGIHPSYVQEMLKDSRYSPEDIISVIEYLNIEGGKKFSFDALNSARHFYKGDSSGSWSPSEVIDDKKVLLLGTGPGVEKHKQALEQYIRLQKPYVIALNTQQQISSKLIDLRVACHPVRLLADYRAHALFPQPLVTPVSILPSEVKIGLEDKVMYDYGLSVKAGTFEFHKTACVLPSSLVVGYALALATSGNARCIYLAGFDGYSSDDPRNAEMNEILKTYQGSEGAKELIAITPSRYNMQGSSVYGML